MATVVVLALRFRRTCPGKRADLALRFVGRSLQACVVLLTLVALSNVALLIQLQAAGRGI